MVIVALIVAFIVSLNMIAKMVPALIGDKGEQQQAVIVKQEVAVKQETAVKQTPAAQTEENNKPVAEEAEEPRYDFYTILPQAEVVVPDYEIKTRVREELVGKTKAAKYIMQAGSFREAAEADRHKAKLALLGIESRIEKAKVGNVIWHRVKIGPYDNPSSVSTIKELLQKNGIGVIVTEIDK